MADLRPFDGKCLYRLDGTGPYRAVTGTLHRCNGGVRWGSDGGQTPDPVPDGRTGRATVKVEPRPGSLSTATEPPCASMMAFTKLSPRPRPRSVRLVSPR